MSAIVHIVDIGSSTTESHANVTSDVNTVCFADETGHLIYSGSDDNLCKGSFENIEAIRNVGIKCSLFCNEFIIDAWQIYYARTKGADAVLLIASVLPDLETRYMSNICKMLGSAALVEVCKKLSCS